MMSLLNHNILHLTPFAYRIVCHQLVASKNVVIKEPAQG